MVEMVRKIITTIIIFSLVCCIYPAPTAASGYISGTGAVYGYNSTNHQRTPNSDILRVTTSGWYIVKYTISKDGFGNSDRLYGVWKKQEGYGYWDESMTIEGKNLPKTYNVNKSAQFTELGLKVWLNPGYQDYYRGLYFSKIVLENGAGDQQIIYLGGDGEPDPEPPAAPTAYMIEKGRDYIKIAWGAPTGATGYKIYKDGALIDTTTGTSYTYTGLDPDTAYNLKIKAYNNDGESPDSNILNIKTDPIPPPDNFHITDKGWYHIKTAWDPVSGVDGYKIYKDGVLVGTTTGTTYEFSGLEEANLYGLGVAAYKGSHQSEIKPLATSTQGVTCCDEIIQLLLSYLPDACSDIRNVWQQVRKDLPALATNVNTIADNTGAIKNDTGSIRNDISALKSYITTPKGAPHLDVDPLPTVTIDTTIPSISEPAQDPYVFDRPAPQMPTPIESPGPPPFNPDPIVMPHDDPIGKDPPASRDPISIDPPLAIEPVSMEPPLGQDPVKMDPPLARDPIIKNTPVIRDPVIGQEGPITADPPFTRTPPLSPGPPKE